MGKDLGGSGRSRRTHHAAESGGRGVWTLERQGSGEGDPQLPRSRTGASDPSDQRPAPRLAQRSLGVNSPKQIRETRGAGDQRELSPAAPPPHRH